MPADNPVVSGDAAESVSAAKISCKGVWKLFGEKAREVYAEHDGNPDPQVLQSAGIIAAVKDASFAVSEGEIFVIMGLSGSGTRWAWCSSISLSCHT